MAEICQIIAMDGRENKSDYGFLLDANSISFVSLLFSSHLYIMLSYLCPLRQVEERNENMVKTVIGLIIIAASFIYLIRHPNMSLLDSLMKRKQSKAEEDGETSQK